jgi:hypothetical protein
MIIQQLAGANKLIALNMFAVVRLELGTTVDKIINDALTVKRLHTGSGNLKLASECATAVAMMAGNVISAGGLSAVGQIVSGSASTLNAIIHSDAKGVASGAAGITTATLDSQKPAESVKNALATSLQESASSSYHAIYEVVMSYFEHKDVELKDTTFEVSKNHTAFIIPHGAGGTSAITYDVKKAITKAYSDMVGELTQELKALQSTKSGSETPHYGTILKILTGSDEVKSQYSTGLHPLTSYVICNALQALKEESTEYKKLQSASRSATGRNQLGYAKHAVMNYYSYLKGSFEHTGSLELDPSYLSSAQQRKSTNMNYDNYNEKGVRIGGTTNESLGTHIKTDLFGNIVR